MQLATNRLYLVPLTAEQLTLWIDDLPTLEQQLLCTYQAEPIEGLFLDIIRGQIERTIKDQAHYLYHTFWLIVRKADRVVIGSADFKDVPNQCGEVEIGYGLGPDFEHKGYMTEALTAMCDWVLLQKPVEHVLAETEATNLASQNVLKRCGFQLYRKSDTFWWRK